MNCGVCATSLAMGYCMNCATRRAEFQTTDAASLVAALAERDIAVTPMDATQYLLALRSMPLAFAALAARLSIHELAGLDIDTITPVDIQAISDGVPRSWAHIRDEV